MRVPDAASTLVEERAEEVRASGRFKKLQAQLRGLVGQAIGDYEMIEEGDDCLAIASQMSAVRKALDSAYVRMTVCFMEQQLGQSLDGKPAAQAELGQVLESVEALLGKIR